MPGANYPQMEQLLTSWLFQFSIYSTSVRHDNDVDGAGPRARVCLYHSRLGCTIAPSTSAAFSVCDANFCSATSLALGASVVTCGSRVLAASRRMRLLYQLVDANRVGFVLLVFQGRSRDSGQEDRTSWRLNHKHRHRVARGEDPDDSHQRTARWLLVGDQETQGAGMDG